VDSFAYNEKRKKALVV